MPTPTIFTAPETPNAKNIYWGLKYYNCIITSPLNQHTQIISNNYMHWFCNIVLPPLNCQQLQNWQNFLLQLEGKKHAFYLEIPQIKYTSEFIIKASASSQKDTNIISIANNNSLISQIKPGDIFEINKELKVIRSIDQNNLQIEFYPNLRKAVAENDMLNFHKLIGTFHLAKDEIVFNLNESNISILTINCEEAI